MKNYAYAKSKVNITYFRDSNAKEIDVFIEENNVIHPLEITPIAKVFFQESKQSPKALLFVLVCSENDRKGMN